LPSMVGLFNPDALPFGALPPLTDDRCDFWTPRHGEVLLIERDV